MPSTSQSGSEIHVLANEVIDQIAAGEVVERPAHLVKELLENSLDAGATEITLDVEQGGQWIQIVDNGKGIQPSDLPLAFARHATSKIDSAGDIWQLSSFGFRGEALASIASVSKTSIVSRTSTQEHAYRLDAEFGRLGDVHISGGDLGTSVRVTELFQNVPARLKFMKSDSAEVNQIKQVAKAIALAAPQLALRLRQQNRLVAYWPAQEDFGKRAEQVLDHHPLYTAQGEYEGVQVQIAFSSPHQTVGNTRSMWFFVRNRWVQDKGLQTAVLEAYRNLLMHGEYPVAAIWIDCDPQEVDVNIHPTKSQVKFRDPKLAFRAIHRTLREALERAPWLSHLLPETGLEILEDRSLSAEAMASHAASSLHLTHEPSVDLRPQVSGKASSTNDHGFYRTQYASKEFRPQMGVMEQLKMYAPPREGLEQKIFGEVQAPRWSSLHLVGQLNLTYLVAQSDSEMILIDQHAAHERVAFERLMLAWKAGQIEVQKFLIPLVFELTEHQVQALLQQQEILAKMGIELEQMSAQAVAVSSAPAIIKGPAISNLIEKLMSELEDQGDSFAIERHVGDLFATMACHSVVRAGQALSHSEMRSLLEQMDEFPLSSFCPHGRQVFVNVPFVKIERDFGRIV